MESFLVFPARRRHWANAVLAVDNAGQQSELNIAQHEWAFKYKNQHLEFASAAGIRKSGTHRRVVRNPCRRNTARV
ncbi:protein of unknown function [Cupriavidus taiwanensis]|uniref:Uncharacterized protein n=1 Tax=Cupriavidus taiwanensis TaxID=164546 RepID=A0A9Q7XSI7_9BURK|nr:protein of unknown function [Cupriavidus taiwanensis]